MLPEISRRTVTRGAAWTVPAIAVAAAAPAVALSPVCETGTTLVHRDWAPTGSTSGTLGDATYTLVPLTSQTVTVDQYTDLAQNNSVTSLDVSPDVNKGGRDESPNRPWWDDPRQGWLAMIQRIATNAKAGHGQLLTITFPQPVYGLEFFAYNIDSSKNYPSAYIDHISVTAHGPLNEPAPVLTIDNAYHDKTSAGWHLFDYDARNQVQVLTRTGSTVEAQGDPNRLIQVSPGFADATNGGTRSQRGTIRVQQTEGAITSLTIRYSDTRSTEGGTSQFVYLSPMRWACA